MHYFGMTEAEALALEMDVFRKRVSQALRLGRFQVSGELSIEDEEKKKSWEYDKEFGKK